MLLFLIAKSKHAFIELFKVLKKNKQHPHKQPQSGNKCLLIDKLINKMCYIHTMESLLGNKKMNY